LQTLLDRLGDAAIYASLVSIVVGGGLAHFKLWLIPQEESRRRIGLQKQRFIEHCATSLDRALRQIPAQLVGLDQATTYREMLTSHTADTFRVMAVFRALDQIHERVKALYTFLFATAAFGLMGMLVSLIVERARPYVGLVALVLILAQLAAVIVLRNLADALERYEHTT